VLAFELPNAARQGKLASYTCTDLLGRPIILRPDAAPPVYAESSNDMLQRYSDAAGAGSSSSTSVMSRGGSGASPSGIEPAWALDEGDCGTDGGARTSKGATAWLVPRASALAAAAAGSLSGASSTGSTQQVLLPYPGPSGNAVPAVPTLLVPASEPATSVPASQQVRASSAGANAPPLVAAAPAVTRAPAIASASAPAVAAQTIAAGTAPLAPGGGAARGLVPGAGHSPWAPQGSSAADTLLPTVAPHAPLPRGYIEYLVRYRAAAAAAAAAAATSNSGAPRVLLGGITAGHLPAAAPPGPRPRPSLASSARPSYAHPPSLPVAMPPRQSASSFHASLLQPLRLASSQSYLGVQQQQQLNADSLLPLHLPLPRAIPGLTMQQVQEMQQRISLQQQQLGRVFALGPQAVGPRMVTAQAAQAHVPALPPALPPSLAPRSLVPRGCVPRSSGGLPPPPPPPVVAPEATAVAPLQPREPPVVIPGSFIGGASRALAAAGAAVAPQSGAGVATTGAAQPGLLHPETASVQVGTQALTRLQAAAAAAAAAGNDGPAVSLPTVPSGSLPATSAPATPPAPLVRSYYSTGAPPQHLHPLQYCGSTNKPLVAFWNIGNMVRHSLGGRCSTTALDAPLPGASSFCSIGTLYASSSVLATIRSRFSNPWAGPVRDARA
jgi:hypothetical protein